MTVSSEVRCRAYLKNVPRQPNNTGHRWVVASHGQGAAATAMYDENDWLIEGKVPKPWPVAKDSFWSEWSDILVHQALVRVGRLGKLPEACDFDEMRRGLRTNPCLQGSGRFWRRAFMPGRPEIEWLVRGYVIVGARMNWPSTYLDPLIPLFPMLRERMQSDQFDGLVEWVIRYSHNPLVPFGRRTQAVTWSQHLLELEIKKARAEFHRQRELEQVEACRELKSSKRRRHIEREERSRARTQQRRRTLDWLQQLKESERLRWLALQYRYPLGALPATLFTADQSILMELSKSHRLALLERLQAAPNLWEWSELRSCLRDAERITVLDNSHVDG
jgi:hypothetical protein